MHEIICEGFVFYKIHCISGAHCRKMVVETMKIVVFTCVFPFCIERQLF